MPQAPVPTYRVEYEPSRGYTPTANSLRCAGRVKVISETEMHFNSRWVCLITIPNDGKRDGTLGRAARP